MTQQEFFNRYQYNPETDHIGGGTFGDVYKAYDLKEDKEVAIKVAKIVKHGDKTFSLKDEFEAVKDVPVHQNIANYYAIYSYNQPTGRYDFAVIQYYKDGNLSDLIKVNDLSFQEKENVALQILDGLAFLHQHRVVHRDMKPSNILVHKRKLNQREEIIPKIADFGLSKKAKGDRSRFTNSFGGGTLAYSSPEQLKNHPLKFNTDLWAWAVIVYELFTGKRLFDAQQSHSTGSAEQENEIYQQIVDKNTQIALTNLPKNWEKALAQCLERDPDKRVKTAREIKEILQGNTQTREEEQTVVLPEEETIIQEKQEVGEEKKEERKKKQDTNTGRAESANSHAESTSRHAELVSASQPKSKKGLWLALGVLALLLVGFFIWKNREKGDIKPEPITEETAPIVVNDTINTNNAVMGITGEVDSVFVKQDSLAYTNLNVKDKKALESFIEEYKEGEYVTKAKGKLQELKEKDEADWKKAKKANTKESYELYCKNHKEGKYYKEAEKKINSLQDAPINLNVGPKKLEKLLQGKYKVINKSFNQFDKDDFLNHKYLTIKNENFFFDKTKQIAIFDSSLSERGNQPSIPLSAPDFVGGGDEYPFKIIMLNEKKMTAKIWSHAYMVNITFTYIKVN